MAQGQECVYCFRSAGFGTKCATRCGAQKDDDSMREACERGLVAHGDLGVYSHLCCDVLWGGDLDRFGWSWICLLFLSRT